MNILVNLIFLLVIAAIVMLLFQDAPLQDPYKKAIKMLLLFLLLLAVVLMATGRLLIFHIGG